MSRQSAIKRSRRAAKKKFVDTCDVLHKTGQTAQNETTMKEEPVYTARFTSVPCKVQTAGTFGAATVTRRPVGGREQTKARYEIHFPHDEETPEVGDTVLITAVNERLSDPELVGKRYRVLAPYVKTWQTAHRFAVEEIF